MRRFAKLMCLPTADDIWHEGNYLGMRLLSTIPGERTREDYREYLKANFPVRFFLAYTVIDAVRNAWWDFCRPIKEAHYWFVSHVIPSRRYHMLDLRQPNYRYGWCDVDYRLGFAMFNLLNQFVDHELEHKFCPPETDTDDWSVAHRKTHEEIRALHHWWNVERRELQKQIDDLSSDQREQRWKLEDMMDKKTTEMMIRLVKVREYLWT
jgi:hypothetical protein